jgi:acetolactate synthase-1/2/3 large subunit
LAPTLEAAFSGGGVHLISAPVDYSENKRVLVDELRAKPFPLGSILDADRGAKFDPD